jgi:hypothetical protein
VTGSDLQPPNPLPAHTKELDQPEGPEGPPEEQDPRGLRGRELEPGQKRSTVDSRIVPERRMLGGQLERPVATARIFEIDQPHLLAVPQVVGQVPIALAEH